MVLPDSGVISKGYDHAVRINTYGMVGMVRHVRVFEHKKWSLDRIAQAPGLDTNKVKLLE